MQQAQKLDERFNTGTAFRCLYDHMIRCSSDGGLHATAICYFVMKRAPNNVILTHADKFDDSFEQRLTRLLQVFKSLKQSPLLAHGLLFGVSMDNKDAVWLQLLGPRDGITFSSPVASPNNVDVDTFVI